MVQIRSLFPLLSESPNETLSSSKVILLESESTSEIYSEIKQKAGADKIFRLSVFLTHKDQLIFSAPAGPDMNDGIGDLMFCAKVGFSVIEKLGIKPSSELFRAAEPATSGGMKNATKRFGMRKFLKKCWRKKIFRQSITRF